MKTRLIGFSVCIFIIASALGVVEAALQNPVPLTNDDVISLKRAGIGDEVIIQKISSGPTKFSTDAADLIALKNGGISDAVIAAMLKLSSSQAKPETNSDSGVAGIGQAGQGNAPTDVAARDKMMLKVTPPPIVAQKFPPPKSMDDVASACDEDRVNQAKAAAERAFAAVDGATRAKNPTHEIEAIVEANRVVDHADKILRDNLLVCWQHLNFTLDSILSWRRIVEDHETPKGVVQIPRGGFLRVMQRAEEFICLPDPPIKPEQAAKIFVKWAKDHPQWLHESSEVHIYAALYVAFPCKEVEQQ